MERVLILTADSGEELEVYYMLYRLREAGYEVEVAAPERKTLQLVVQREAWNHRTVRACVRASQELHALIAANSDQTRIDLGVAYLKSGEAKQARETFAAVKADSEWRGLAELWSVRANEASQDTKQPSERQPKK